MVRRRASRGSASASEKAALTDLASAPRNASPATGSGRDPARVNLRRDPSGPEVSAVRRVGQRPGSLLGPRFGGGSRRLGIAGLERDLRDLGGEQSPWKDRVSSRWQRRCDTTDSLAEQGPEVGRFADFDEPSRRPHLGGTDGVQRSDSRPRPRGGRTTTLGWPAVPRLRRNWWAHARPCRWLDRAWHRVASASRAKTRFCATTALGFGRSLAAAFR